MTDNGRQPDQLKASDRLAAALGRPPARPLTEEERRAFELEQDIVDADLERKFGPYSAA